MSGSLPTATRMTFIQHGNRRAVSFRSVTGAELLETLIFAQWVPNWIDPKVADGNAIWHFEQMRQSGDSRIDVASLCLDLSERGFSEGFCQGIAGIVGDGLSRLLQRLLLFAKTAVGPGEINLQLSRIDNDNRVRGWFHRRNRARKSSASVFVFSGKLLALTEQGYYAGIVRF